MGNKLESATEQPAVHNFKTNYYFDEKKFFAFLLVMLVNVKYDSNLNSIQMGFSPNL